MAGAVVHSTSKEEDSGNNMEYKEEGVEIPVIFVAASRNERGIKESGPVEQPSRPCDEKRWNHKVSESFRLLSQRVKANYQSREHGASTDASRSCDDSTTTSASTKESKTPRKRKVNTMLSSLSKAAAKVKEHQRRMRNDHADGISEDLMSSLADERSYKSKSTVMTFESISIDDRSVGSRLSNLVAEREGEVEEELEELIDILLCEFDDKEVKKGLNEELKSVGFARRTRTYLRTSAEGTLAALVDEIDGTEMQQAMKNPDAWNDLIGCGALPHPELLVDNCGAVAAIACLNDTTDDAIIMQGDDGTLDLYLASNFDEDSGGDDDTLSDLGLFFDDDSAGGTLEDAMGDTLDDAVREHDFTKAMELLKKSAARQGVNEVNLLEKIRAEQTSRVQQSRQPSMLRS